MDDFPVHSSSRTLFAGIDMEDQFKKQFEILNDHAKRLADHGEKLEIHDKRLDSLEVNVRGIYQIIDSFRSMFMSAETLWSTIADDVKFHKFVDGILIVFGFLGLLMLGVDIYLGTK